MSMKLKTIEVVGPAGQIKVNVSDLKMWRIKGYRPVDDVESESENPSGVAETPLEEMTVPELRDVAEKEKIDLSGLAKKRDILDYIKDVRAEREGTPETGASGNQE